MTMFAMKPKFDLAAFLAANGPKPDTVARAAKARAQAPQPPRDGAVKKDTPEE